MQLVSLVPLLLLLAGISFEVTSSLALRYKRAKTGSSSLNELNISGRLLQKIVPFATVPADLSRTQRVGAQRYQQFGPRCWHLEPCDECVCCGHCGEKDFICNSPAGSLDYCMIYEKISLYTDLESRNTTVNHKLPDDFPDIPPP